MKKAFIAFSLIFHISLTAQWFTQNPLPTSNGLYSITFPSNNIGYAVGDNRYILKSIDGGISWNKISVENGVNSRLTSVFFISDSIGFVCGMSYFAKTIDGGETWLNLTPVNSNFTSVFFINETIGFLSSEDNHIYKTNNGGNNWSSQELVTGNSGLTNVYFLEPDTGFCIGYQEVGMDDYDGKIFKTENAGISWFQVATTTNKLNEIRFHDKEFGTAVGSYGYILSTIDGGNNWTEQNICDSCILKSVTFPDDTSILVVGYSPAWIQGGNPQLGVIYKSSDSGNNWNKIITPYSEPLYSIAKLNDSSFYTSGYLGTLMYSFDLGKNWALFSTNIFQGDLWLNDIAFFDSMTGTIGGQLGSIAKTIDGGESWSLLETNYMGTFRKFCFVDTNILIASTSNGIYKSVDGGSNWTQNFYVSAKDVDFINSNIGFATEASNYLTGKLFKTTNSGENWFLSTEFDERVSEIQFLNESVGYVLGMYSIYQTLDGGATWLKKSIGTNNLLHSFFFTDQNTGFAVGNTNCVYKTINSGDTWSTYNLPGSTKNSIRFIDENIGIIVAQGGTIFKTEDAGNQWILQESTTNSYLTSVALLENGLAFAVGNGSTILKTENYGGDGIIIVKIEDHQKNTFNNLDVLVYPIPTQTNVTIEYRLADNSQIEITITDLKGIEIQHMEKNHTIAGKFKLMLSLKERKAGLYFCTITINGKKEIFKIIKINDL